MLAQAAPPTVVSLALPLPWLADDDEGAITTATAISGGTSAATTTAGGGACAVVTRRLPRRLRLLPNRERPRPRNQSVP